jgi:hypothetical protein
MARTKEIERLHAQRFFTSGAVARKFGISLTTLRRLEGKLFAPVAVTASAVSGSSRRVRWRI